MAYPQLTVEIWCVYLSRKHVKKPSSSRTVLILAFRACTASSSRALSWAELLGCLRFSAGANPMVDCPSGRGTRRNILLLRESLLILNEKQMISRRSVIELSTYLFSIEMTHRSALHLEHLRWSCSTDPIKAARSWSQAIDIHSSATEHACTGRCESKHSVGLCSSVSWSTSKLKTCVSPLIKIASPHALMPFAIVDSWLACVGVLVVQWNLRSSHLGSAARSCSHC